MYFQLRSLFQARIVNETLSCQFCQNCKVYHSKPNYENIFFKADKLVNGYSPRNARCVETWPMSIGSIESLLLHQDVVLELNRSNIKGLKFHPITGIGGEVLKVLPPPPIYYKVEPIGYAEFEPSKEKFEFLSCICGIRPKYFGDFIEPFDIKLHPTDHLDCFYLKHYLFWVCVTKSLIDVLVKNKWTDDFEIGSRALPGIQIREFGSTWYEDTLKQLRTSFPNSTILE